MASTETVRLERFGKGLRTADIPPDGTIRLGIPRWVAELHRAAFPTDESHVHAPGTFEYLVAAVAGCLLDHYGTAVELRGLPATDRALTSSAFGEVVEEPDRCLMVAAVHIVYSLEVPSGYSLDEQDRAQLERALETHTRRCPIARTLRGRTAIVASTTVVQQGSELTRLGPRTSNLELVTGPPQAPGVADD